MNLNHWADGAWADGSWVSAAWGEEGEAGGATVGLNPFIASVAKLMNRR